MLCSAFGARRPTARRAFFHPSTPESGLTCQRFMPTKRLRISFCARQRDRSLREPVGAQRIGALLARFAPKSAFGAKQLDVRPWV